MKNFFNAVGRIFKPDYDRVGENGYTKLQTAILKNDLAKVSALLKAGANPNVRGNLVYPPLHLALDKDRHNIAIALLQAGADVDLQDALGKTPLHHAAAQSQESFILTLLKMNANPNIPDKTGRTPLHDVSTARPEIIDVLVSHKANANARDEKGNTPLHVFIDKVPMVERLLKMNADPNVKNDDGVSAYMLLLEDNRLRKYPATLQGMLQSKADVSSCNQLGETVLHLAAKLEMQDTFDAVMPNCELCVKDAQGNNVLHALVRTQNPAMIDKVLKSAPDLLKDKNARGLTPLGELASRAGQSRGRIDAKFIGAVHAFVNAGADPSSPDENGRTLLHHAIEQNQLLFADFLMRKKAALNVQDKQGRAPLHIAIEAKNLAALDHLLDAGADPDLTDARGWTVLDRLAEKGDRDSPVVQRLIVAAGQYKKQLPLNPELMRKREDRFDKTSNAFRRAHGGEQQGAAGLDKQGLIKPKRTGTDGPRS